MKTTRIIIIVFLVSIMNAFAGESILSKEFHQMKKQDKFVVIDLRTPKEWKETGIITGAITKNTYDSDFKEFIKKLDKSKTYVIYCHSGGRSSKVQNMMDSANLKNINIKDGITGWKSNNLPTVKYAPAVNK